MSKNIYDLSQAVKRHLTSNSTLVNLVQGQASNSADLAAQIDEAIMEAANNARLYAERLHDFAFNDMTGKALLTNGCPLHLDHVPVRQNYGDVDSLTPWAIVGINSSEDEWPEVLLSNAYIEHTNITSLKFGGTVAAPLVAGESYTVFSSRETEEGYLALKFGFPPGEELTFAGMTVTASVSEVKKFKTIQQVYQYDSANRSIKPISTVRRRSQVLRNIRLQGLSSYSAYPSEDMTREEVDMQAIIAGREVHIEPAGSVHIAVDGNVWMDTYDDITDTDPLLQHGFDFMMWQTIIEVNHMLLKFVARQEGTIAPPTQARDAAFDSLIIWDSLQADGNIHHDL